MAWARPVASPFALGQQTLDNMIEEILILTEAEQRGIAVSDQEVEEALREEIANLRTRIAALPFIDTFDLHIGIGVLLGAG